MKTFKLKTTFLLLLLSALLLKADNGLLIPSDKLSSTLINCITQDAYGLMWVGTDYGLNRYDGYHFTSYLHEAKDTTSITDNIVTSFCIDKKKRFWIGTAKGLMQYDYSTNTFHRVPCADKRTPRIYCIIESHTGEILAGTAGYGLYKVDEKARRLVRCEGFTRRNVDDEFFTHIYEDSQGNLWKSSHLPTFYCFSQKNGKVTKHIFHSRWGAPVSFLPIGRGQLLIVCMYGIANYNYYYHSLTTADFDLSDFKGGLTINTALVDYKGDLLLGTTEHGILRVPRGSQKAQYYQTTPSPFFNLNSAFINTNCLYEDKDNNLWAGCYSKGLYLDNHEDRGFQSWSFASQGYSTSGCVSSIAPGDDGDAWCTVRNSGVFHFDKYGKITGHPASPAGTSIIYRDRKGNYWVGSNSAIYSYNPESGDYKAVLNFESAGVYSIIDGGDGKLYISAYSKGIYVYDTTTHKAINYNMRQRTPLGFLCNDWVRNLFFDRRGLLWAATSNGISCFNPKYRDFRPLGRNKILSDIQSNVICDDDNGNMVIGTDKGLYFYDVLKDSTMIFPNSDELRNKQICGIVKAGDGNLWISTSMGIWHYDSSMKQFFGHVSGNGLVAHEYVQGSYTKLSDGRIAFGTSEGITAFYPRIVKNLSKDIGVPTLTGFYVGDSYKDFREHEYTLSHKENSFTLEFSMLNFKRKGDIAFRYRVNDGDWLVNDESDNSISFNQMKPGKYKIEVQATNNGMTSESLVLDITIRSPWYATTGAYALYIILIACIILYIYHVREQRIRTDADEQKMRFLIDATHDIRSPLTLILGPIKKLKTRITDKEDKDELDIIDHNAQRLLILVNQILDERKIDKGQMVLQCEETDLVDFTAHSVHLFQYGAQERNINIIILDDKGAAYGVRHKPVMVWIDRVNFDKVICNLVSNALKYSFDGGEIDIVISENDDTVSMKVIDNGIGFKEGGTEKLFDRFYQGKNARDLKLGGTGIGLNLCRNIVNMHGGRIRAYNRTDGRQGACFEVTLRKGCEHLRLEEIMPKEEEEIAEEGTKKSTANNVRVLVVDDDYEIPAYISHELGRWYHFDSAPNGKMALEKILTTGYDLVISDVMMPEMDGITMLKKIKGNPRTSDIPVILLTSKSEIGNRLEGLRKGADAFLAKPFAIDELHILIDNLIGNVRRLRGKFTGAQDQREKIENVTVKGNDESLMDRIMKSVNAHMDDPEFNVEKLAEDVGISRAQLHRKMKEMTGISTSEFIRNLRLEQAAKLIREGNINITQVAYAVGYNNQTHFSTVFKKHFGVAPSNYNKPKE